MGSPSAAGIESLHKDEAQTNDRLTPRAYQLEMLEESLHQNVIIAMETGSGKTLIAILRMQAELETCPVDKLVWFCVPTVALAVQQHASISKQLPAYQSRVLSGNDNCEFWTQKTWTEVLKGTRIVVSTHAVLFDALVHAFVKMDQLSLLIFDEAHRATKDHPANQIMQMFYHPTPAGCRPSILGLSASPVINDDVASLKALESNLNAIARTPKLHRFDLVRCVHKPELVQIIYSPDSSFASASLEKLSYEYDVYDLSKDPWIMKMESETDPTSVRQLRGAIRKQKTWCRENLRSVHERAKRIAVELGSWATERYIHDCFEKFRNLKAQNFAIEETIEDRERVHLQSILDKIDTTTAVKDEFVPRPSGITPKVRALINFLAEQDTLAFAGLVFVETRAEVAMLSQLLMLHLPTRTFDISTFVGESHSSNRKFALGELADIRNQKTTLDDLRDGIKNLVISTNALEEGIDVSACNLVVCFQKPPNLKSFVQRRGRARKKISKYVIMLEETEGTGVVAKWKELEDLMRNIYENDMRELERLEKFEDEEDDGRREFVVEATGAKLNMLGALNHLYRFCNSLSCDPYVDQAPIFFYEDHVGSDDDKIREISARVVLPPSVDISVREARSKERWASEKNAKRDAAFESYIALYHAGLINDHLLPKQLTDPQDDAEFAAMEKRPNLAEVDEQIDVWSRVAEQWHLAGKLHQFSITIGCGEHQWIETSIILPVMLPHIPKFFLFWDANHTFEVTIGQSDQSSWIENTDIVKAATHLILSSLFGSRMSTHQLDFLSLFVPPVRSSSPTELQSWLDLHKGSSKADETIAKMASKESSTPGFQRLISRGEGLVRDQGQPGASHILLRWRWGSYEDALLATGVDAVENVSNEPQLLLTTKRFPRRTDFLHQVADLKAHQQGLGIRNLLAKTCRIDNLPWRFAMFASLVPSILHVIHKTMLVDQLCTGLLAPLEMQDRSLVSAAISAPSAGEPTDYQRLEFLGDSVLKLFTSMALIAQHLIHDEGQLSNAKDQIVSNVSLSLAAVKAGLAPYILTKAFTKKKWRPLYVSDILADKKTHETREMSTKTLADVVESLIGAAFLDGGETPTKALACLKIFLPRVDWTYTTNAHSILKELYHTRAAPTPPILLQIEELLGHRFDCKILLLEAMTHASYRGSNTSASYQRLEFLGDSILDSIVTTDAFHQDPPLPVHRLHLIRTALVNGHFLGYLCMRLSSIISRTEIRNTGPKSVETFDTEVSFMLWQAMRHSNASIASDQKACLARYEELNGRIASALSQGKQYPWTLLGRLEPPKPFSDMIESIIAAIWIDSDGSLTACSAFLERLGLVPYLRRVLQHEDLALLHPKEELGQLADQDTVSYTVTVTTNDTGQKCLTCKVTVGEREVVDVGDGLTRTEVKTRAADEACKILKGEGRRLRKKGKVKMGEDDGPAQRRRERRGEREDEEEEGDEEDDEDRDKDEEAEAVAKNEYGGSRTRQIQDYDEDEDDNGFDEDHMDVD